jgi:glycosyltransferase involved in cell wall biosynthesis
VALTLGAAGHDVLFVDPPLSPLSVLRHRSRAADARAPADETVAEGVRLWRPKVLPGQNSALGQAVNARLLLRGVRRRMPDPELTIAFGLESRGVFADMGGRRVYYVTDSLEDLPGADVTKTRGWERAQLRAADVVVACSLPLCEQLRGRGVDPVYLPHACDDDSLAEPGPVPAELADLPRPIVGYVGSLNFRIDVALLAAARRAIDGGTLVVVGGAFGPPPSPEAAALLAQPGVVVTGHRGPEILPSYLSALDVGLVPYTLEPFNRKSFPIKVLQYLAAGAAVVSTANGATDELGAAVTVADDPDAFEAAVRTALEDNDAPARASRHQLASTRRWTENVARLLEMARP